MPLEQPRSRHRRQVSWLVFIGIALLVLLISVAGEVGRLGAHAFVVAVLLATVTIPFTFALVLWVDRHEPEPWRMLALTFLWGVSIAGFFAGISNAIGSTILDSDFGVTRGQLYTTSFWAPAGEELLKGAALFFIFLMRRREFNGIVDGVVYALMVGLGFAASEDVFYYGHAALTGGIHGAYGEFLSRGLMGGLMHPFFTSMTGIGLGIAATTRNRKVKVLAPIAGLVAAIALHSLNNSLADGLAGAQYFVLSPIFFIAAAAFVFVAIRREGRIVREFLPRDLLEPGEVERLTSVRARVEDAVSAFREGGFSALQARYDYVGALTDIAFARYRASRGGPEANGGGSNVEAQYRERLGRLRLASFGEAPKAATASPVQQQ